MQAIIGIVVLLIFLGLLAGLAIWAFHNLGMLFAILASIVGFIVFLKIAIYLLGYVITKIVYFKDKNGDFKKNTKKDMFLIVAIFSLLAVGAVLAFLHFDRIATIKSGTDIGFFDKEINKLYQEKQDKCFGKDGDFDPKDASYNKLEKMIAYQKSKNKKGYNILLEISKDDTSESRAIRCLVIMDGIYTIGKNLKIEEPTN